MFLFRWIKNLVVLILVIAGIFYISEKQWNGKSAKQYIADIYESGHISEAFKDISTWIGSLFKAGKQITSAKDDSLTDNDREKLEKVIKNELKLNIEKLKEGSKP